MFLAASLVWPSSGFTGNGRSANSIAVPIIASSVGQPQIRARSQGFKPVPDRHISKLRGVLDDDPAMLADEWEDWIEDSIGLVSAYLAAPAHASFFMATTVDGMCASLPSAPTSPLHVLCRYQC